MKGALPGMHRLIPGKERDCRGVINHEQGGW